MDIERLRTRQEEIRHRLQEIEAETGGEMRLAAGRSQQLDGEVTTLLNEFDRNDKLIRVADASRSRSNREGGFGAPEHMRRVEPFAGDLRSADNQQVRSRALKALETEGTRLRSDQQDQVDMLVRADTEDLDGSYIARRMLVTERPAYRAAWQRVMTGVPGQTFLTAEESEALRDLERLDHSYYGRRALAEGTNSAGGYGIPVLIDPTIILTSGAADAPLLRASRIETVTTDVWKGVSSAGMTWSYDAEASAVSDDSPTVAQPVVPVYMARGWIPYSIEVGMDYPQFASSMAMLIEQGYIDLLAKQTVTGSGSSQPRGTFNAIQANTTGSVIAPTTTGSFGAPDIFKVWNALPERSRGRATWLMNVYFESTIRQFGTNANSSAYFTVDLTADGITRINGRPTIVTDYAPATPPSTSGAQNLLMVADLSNYLIAQRAGMQLEQVPVLFDQSTGRPTGQRGWFAWARNGADSINDNGFRLLRNSN